MKFDARVKNVVGKPADVEWLVKLDQLLGKAGTQIRRFYELHDGATLYSDTLSDASGIEFFKIRDWEDATAEMHESLDAMGISSNEMPDWFSGGVAFGQIPHSANYLIVGTERDADGRIFYVDHDDLREEPVAEDFEQLQKLIMRDPAAFLMEVGCYTRFSDGTTDTQWIPAEFVNE